MLYFLEVDIDFAAMGDRREALIAEEERVARARYEEGVMLRFWLKASRRGAYSVWDCPDHDSVTTYLKGLPLYPWFSRIVVTPISPHPLFGALSGPR